MSNTVPLASPPTPAPVPMVSRKKCIWAVIIAFLLGFLLGWFLHKCPQKDKNPMDAGSGTANVGGSPAGGGGGSKIQVSGGGTGTGGGGGGGAGGNIKGSGTAGSGPANGDDDNKAGDAPDGKPGNAKYTPGSGAASAEAGNVVTQMASGKLNSGNVKVPPSADSLAHIGVLSAADFSYDSTNLPRYANGVQSVASGISTDSVRHTKSALTAIVTNDSFDSVVTWYKSQLPAGWKASSMGNMEATAKSLSPQSIAGMISGAMSGKSIDTTAIKAAQDSSGGTSIAMFNPPNQSADGRSIMIVRRKNEATKVMMSRKMKQ